MFCPYCGKKIINDEAVFCMNCGNNISDDLQQVEVAPPKMERPVQQTAYSQAPVSQSAAAPQAVTYHQSAPVHNTAVSVKTGRKSPWIPLIAIILIGAIVAAFFFFRTNDEDKIRDRIKIFTSACNDMDMKTMMECMDKTTRRQYEAMLGLADGLLGAITGADLPFSDMAELMGMENAGDYEMEIEILSIEIDGDVARVEVVMSERGVETERETMIMCKEGDEWYIDFNEMTGGLNLF